MTTDRLLPIVVAFLLAWSGCGGGEAATDDAAPEESDASPFESSDAEEPATATRSQPATAATEDHPTTAAPVPRFAPVATGIEMHPDKRITAGDDIIVYGTGGFAGVDYMVPSAGDSAGRGIPEGDTFHASSFAVAGKKIALVNNFEVSIFDTATGMLRKIPGSVLRLTTVPGQLHDAGHMHSDGNYVIARSDDSTDDRRHVKMIDVSTDEPQVIGFRRNPPGSASFVTHVLIDADAGTAVAATQEAFFIYDVNSPEDDPVQIDIPDGIGDLPPQLDGGHILFQDRVAYMNTLLLNIATREITPLPTNPSAGVLALTHGSLAYFVNTSSNDTVGNGVRSAIGRVDRLNGLVVAPEREFINGRTANHGAIGYGQTVGITEDDGTWLLGGLTSVGAGEYLQVSTGGGFELVPDPLENDEYGCYATDITLSRNTVAFKTKGEDNRAAYVGYMVLGR